MLDGGHAECFAQVIRNEGRVTAGFWELAFIEGQHNKITEVKITRFQHSHYLHADSRFAMKRDVGWGEQTIHQTFQGVCLQAQSVALYQAE